MRQIELRPPTEEAFALSQELITLFEQQSASLQTAHEAMLWTIVISAAVNAGAATWPLPDPESEGATQEYMRLMTFFTSFRMLTAGLIEQL